MALLLKQLDIHGFKSFATPTTFVFDRGITAIVGPNGSGKSNVAEALRWVLGEQGHANLRSRRTDDVIFAGSDKRAQLGLAEVVLTLDNQDGDLPLSYSEITISRRAFRSGESQYLINGSRVRLKDVQQLVAPLGQSYTIIGQGLVDAALSQRPEERRGLFEHAAGISGLRLRANEAERSLAESMANAQRLRDILSELEPRVRSLERSARLAREYGAVRDSLVALQQRYYAHLWSNSTAKLHANRQALHVAEHAHQELEEAHVAASRRLSGLRGDERRLADEHRELSDRIVRQERELAEAEHRRELLDAHTRAAADRLSDLDARISELLAEQSESEQEADAHRRDAADARSAIQTLEAKIADVEAASDERRRQQHEQRTAIARANQQLVELSRRLAEADGTRQTLVDRLSGVEVECSSVCERLGREQERLNALRETSRSLVNAIREHGGAVGDAEAAVETIDRQLANERGILADQRSILRASEQELADRQARHDALERARASGDGLYAGVRAVVRAANRNHISLPGMIGTVAEAIDVPDHLETAIEVALGGHLQDIIVESWADAQAAIDYLKRSKSGRATFQPLDTVKPGRRPTPERDIDGVLGVAADLVSFDPRLRPVIEQLLGRTLVVDDLDIARRILSQSNGFTIVTVTGEITRPSGSVTGGGPVAESGLLGRERERRLLPKLIAERQSEVRAHQSAFDSTSESLAKLEQERQLRQEASDTARRRLVDAEMDHDRLLVAIADAEASVTRAIEQRDGLTEREREISAASAALDARRAIILDNRAKVQAERERAQADLDDRYDDGESIAGLRSELAAARERLRTAEEATQRVAQRAVSTARSIEARRSEADKLRTSADGSDAERSAIDREIVGACEAVAVTRDALPPVQRQRDELSTTLTDAERTLVRAAERLRDAERERDRATLTLARVQDEQVFLSERIRSDLELDDPAALEACEINETDLPSEQEIARLRDRLRRMSNVGEDVLEQFETESARLAYLSSQLADLDQAADGLRNVLAELNGKMTTRFEETFRHVAIAFEQTFSRLFGGGTARLVMSAGDGAAGIDIVAQPPGKRLQNLTALSGGERALTAVALLIAIQRVNPSPFCLLDEVDAALDESNVVRFRDELRDLAGSTQYVIITHNRGTIEGADILYGVTMGDDGISRVLSLRLEDAILAVEEYETVQSVSS